MTIYFSIRIKLYSQLFSANGTNRAESCVSVVLQKASEAKRSYGTLLNATGLFGETNDLLCHYSDQHYKEVLINAYKEANVDPGIVAYVEGEGLAVKVPTYTFFVIYV